MADTQLEKDDFLKWDLRGGFLYVKDKVCRDWDRVHVEVSDGYESFRDLIRTKHV